MIESKDFKKPLFDFYSQNLRNSNLKSSHLSSLNPTQNKKLSQSLSEIKKAYFETVEEIKKTENFDLSSSQKSPSSNSLKNKVLGHLETYYKKEGLIFQERIFNEIFKLGPLETLISNETINEIFINHPNSIWYEKNNQTLKHNDEFFSFLSFRNAVQRIFDYAKISVNLNFPFASGRWKDFRVHVISSPITKNHFSLSLRRHRSSPWNFSLLEKTNFLQKAESQKLLELIQNKRNFIIVGPTGSGKTTLLNACLQNILPNERVLIIEDTDEITPSNSLSVKLLTRKDPHGTLNSYDASDLVRESLRMKPDRLVIGEIRGKEAKDLLIALSTGHKGSLSTLHAENPHQALIRLEMLTQMGAPHWNLNSIRQMIRLSLEYIVVLKTKTEKESSPHQNQNKRYLSGIYKITSLEETGFLIEKIT